LVFCLWQLHSPTLILFDLGRVLIRICDDWRHAARVAGVPVQAELGPDQQRVLYDAVCRAEVGQLDGDAFAQLAAELFGAEKRDVEVISQAYLLDPCDGAVELIDAVRSAGLRTACLTNTYDTHWRILTDPARPYAAILNRLDQQFASHLMGLRKPDEPCYRHVERATGASGQEIVFFDDIKENVAAAEAIGWRAFRVDPAGDPIAQMRTRLREIGIAV
jgi:HAD superfamily hydrolase (TIGR01509 family)